MALRKLLFTISTACIMLCSTTFASDNKLCNDDPDRCPFTKLILDRVDSICNAFWGEVLMVPTTSNVTERISLQLGIRKGGRIDVRKVYTDINHEFINIHLHIPVVTFASRMDLIWKLGARFRHHEEVYQRFPVIAHFTISLLARKGIRSRSSVEIAYGYGHEFRKMNCHVDLEMPSKDSVRKYLKSIIPTLQDYFYENPITEEILIGIPGLELGELEPSPPFSEVWLGQLPDHQTPKIFSNSGFDISGTWVANAEIRPYHGYGGIYDLVVRITFFWESRSMKVKYKIRNPGTGLLRDNYHRYFIRRKIDDVLYEREITRISWRVLKHVEEDKYYLELNQEGKNTADRYEFKAINESQIEIGYRDYNWDSLRWKTQKVIMTRKR